MVSHQDRGLLFCDSGGLPRPSTIVNGLPRISVTPSVAVTGIPSPQRDHAIIMTKFARDCMLAMRNVLVSDLAQRLGEDTLQLEMRVGLHSGPTTAGVLRGEKVR